MNPLISIVIPTRNRPEYVRFAIESMARQSHSDFEVIVSDNHVGRPCKAEFDRFADNRFRYVVPPTPLNMHDHWEFAVEQAAGDYVGVLIDKTVLRQSAIGHLVKVISTHPADAYSWWNEGYDLLEELAGNMGPGRYTRSLLLTDPSEIDLADEISHRLEFPTRRGNEGTRYFHGKICFGVYSRPLIQRIRDTFGRVFKPISPDYTSMIAALALADLMIDVGRPLLISMNTRVSNGLLLSTQSQKALDFLREVDPTLAIIDRLPIAGLYTSHHNLVAHDYMRLAGAPIPSGQEIQINLANLALRAREDLANVQVWGSEDERSAQFALFESFVEEHDIKLPAESSVGEHDIKLPLKHKAALKLDRITPVKALKRAVGKVIATILSPPPPPPPPPPREYYDSVIEAAAAAD